MKSNSLIICDLSDVIVKGLEGCEAALATRLHEPVEKVAHRLFTYDYTPLWYGNIMEKEFFTQFLKATGWPITLYELLTIIHENFYEIEGSRSIYEALRKHHTLVLYSVNCPEWVQVIREVVDYEDLFDKEFYSYDLKADKKETSGFKKIMELYPHHSYYLIDDSSSNIRTAESLGITGIRFASSEQLLIDLKERGLL